METRKTEPWYKTDKFLFGLIILLGYMIGWLLTGFIILTPEQAQLFSQGLATLGPVVGMIAASIWKFTKDELEERKSLSDTLTTLADKPPVVVKPEELIDEPIDYKQTEESGGGNADAPWYSPDCDPTADPSC